MNLLTKLKNIALNKTTPFYYHCYKEAPTGKCNLCQTDDLMRLLPEIGCEYGTDWIIEHLVSDNIDPINVNLEFEHSLEDLYPTNTQIGWINFNTISAIKELDPISYDLAKGEWLDSMIEDEYFITFDHGNTYYSKEDVESFADQELY